MGSGLTASRSEMFSHFTAKLVTRLAALGSAIMRATCLSRTPGFVNPFAAASVSNASSGPVFQRKKERRDANSRSVRGTSAALGEADEADAADALPRVATGTPLIDR